MNLDDTNIQALKEQIKEGTFYYQKFDLLFKDRIKEAIAAAPGILEVSFECGHVTVFIDKMKKVKRPSNIIAEFEYCYLLKNSYDEYIGYIGKKVLE